MGGGAPPAVTSCGAHARPHLRRAPVHHPQRPQAARPDAAGGARADRRVPPARPAGAERRQPPGRELRGGHRRRAAPGARRRLPPRLGPLPVARGSSAARRGPTDDPSKRTLQRKIGSSAKYLADHLAEVPVHVVPCHPGRTEEPRAGRPGLGLRLGAAGRLELHARRARPRASRAPGPRSTSSTSARPPRSSASPTRRSRQVALIPLAHAVGTDFKAGAREPLDSFVHWDAW